jgi:WXG100 family type VII secretion target
MAQYKVSSESLATTSSQLSSGSNDVQTTLAHLRSLVESLGSEWEGAGSGAFNELYTEFNTAGLKLNESLAGIADLLNKAASYYAESEANVTSAFRS